MSGSQDPRSLFALYASGEIAAEQIYDLEAALRQDSALRREFIEYLNVDSALTDLAALTPTELADIERETTTDASRKSVPTVAATASSGWGFRSAVAVAAVGATLLLMASVWFNWPGHPAHEPVATLVTEVDALLLRDRQPCSDSRLRVGEYQLNRGLLHLQFRGGVTVYVEAPAHFEAVSAARVVLHSGRLSASVPPEGVGFAVETPEAEVVDFGTEFSVDVAGGASEVHVFEGRVRVQPRSPSGAKTGNAVDLRTSQAVMIDNVTEKPVEIELATDRFIRTFDESRRRYAHTVKRLVPIAFYRMAIRDQGLACVSGQYSGVVLTGDGIRPPHARGVFAGGSLRVLADSTGRGGRVDSSPTLRTGQFTLTAFVYVEARARSGIVATNIQNDDGNFALTLDERGFLRATARNSDGDLLSVTGESLVELQTWRHIVMTVDAQRLSLYEDGRLVASSPCVPLADSDADILWFGTDADGLHLWDGRIDEVALFDRALSEAEVTELYQAALQEMRNSK